MKDVSCKVTTLRRAIARAELIVSSLSLIAIREKTVPKGDPLEVAKVAAIMAAKKTAEWIPYCHNIPIEFVGVTYELLEDRIIVEVAVTSIAKTGVEIEAMTAASACALTLYDMLKMIDDTMAIESVRLIEKRGGKSDFVSGSDWRSGVLVCSDRVAAGKFIDRSGEVLVAGLREFGAKTVEKSIVPDEIDAIRSTVGQWIEGKIDIILVTGGTGIGPRDVTPEAISPLLDVALPGVVETLRRYGQDRKRTAMMSRSLAGIAGSSVIVAIPGSVGACEDALHALFPSILHARDMLVGGGHE